MFTIKPSDLKRYIQAFIIIIAGGSIFPIMYLRQNFEVPILETFHITNEDLGHYYSVMGIMYLVGYLPSGWLADKFKPKYLMSTALFLTGALGLYFAQIPSSSMLVYIFGGWGFAAGVLFWGAIMKGIKMLAKKEEQGRFFGALDGGRGLVEAVLATIAVGLFAIIVKSNSEGAGEQTKDALVAVIYMYAIFCIIWGLVLMLTLKDNNMEQDKQGTAGNVITNLLKLMKIKEVWMVAAIIFCGYQVFWATYSFSGFLQVNYEVSAVIAGYITVGKLWMRPIGGFGGGFLGDKFGNARVLALSLIFASLGLLSMVMLPGIGSIYFLFVVILLVGVMTYAIRGLYWAILDGCNLPASITGLAIGFISLVGYMPDIFVPLINGYLLTTYEGPLGYKYYFIYIAIIGLIGAAISMYLHYILSKKQ